MAEHSERDTSPVSLAFIRATDRPETIESTSNSRSNSIDASTIQGGLANLAESEIRRSDENSAECDLVERHFPNFADSPKTFDESTPSAELPRLTVIDDFRQMPLRVKDDVAAIWTWDNTFALAVAAGGSAVLRNNIDRKVIHDTHEHGPRWGTASQLLSHGGDALTVHVPLLASMYATSLWQQDEDLHELTLTMFTGYKLTVISTLALQYGTATHRGTDGINPVRDSGFPSESTAASFALAAVVEEKYGWKAGAPAYLLAGLIGWSEVDQNHHTVSDVVFGSVLGYVIGKSVGALHFHPDTPFKLIPIVDPILTTNGLALEVRY